ncbi:MAG: transglycosylase SLT domain-containing protein [Bryobacteraceae bacterium]
MQSTYFPTVSSPLTGVAALEPPRLAPNPFIRDTPRFITEQPKIPPADSRIRRADEHFQEGRRSYQLGDRETARRHFEAAVDLMLEASGDAADPVAFRRRFEEMVDAIHRYDMAGLGAAEQVEEPGFEKAPLEDILEMTFPIDPKLKNKVKAEAQATVSQLPLEVNDSVLSFVNYFSGRGHKTMVAGLQRAGRYRPIIQRILDEEGVPRELIHLAQAESGFLPRARSRKAAVGMWQFLAWRGREYGLMQTPYSDDRLDPEKATRAAARHLRDLYEQFGDWYLAIAAYNCGPGNVSKAVERTGYADFWELRRRRVLPLETTNYVPIIVAMTLIMKNAEDYGLDKIVPDAPLEYDVVDISSPTHLALVADLTEAPVPELQALNPALLKSLAPSGYSLRVPRGTGAALVTALESVPAESRASWRMHRVEAGDTLAAIGKQYGAAPTSIATVNGLESDTPVAGDLLAIPKAKGKSSPARKSVRKSPAKTRISVLPAKRRATTSMAAKLEP